MEIATSMMDSPERGLGYGPSSTSNKGAPILSGTDTEAPSAIASMK
jgi:hypothetical protein